MLARSAVKYTTGIGLSVLICMFGACRTPIGPSPKKTAPDALTKRETIEETFSESGRSLTNSGTLQRITSPVEQRLMLNHQRKLHRAKKINQLIDFSSRQSVEYDNNILSEPKGRERKDIVFVTRGGVRINLIRKKGHRRILENFYLGVAYHFRNDIFARHAEENDFNQFVSPLLNLTSVLHDRRAKVTLRERFRPEVFSVENVDRTERTRVVNDLDLTLDYPLSGRTKFSIPYRTAYAKHFGKDSQSLDSFRHGLHPELTYELSPYTSLFTRGGITFINYRNGQGDATEYTIEKGIRKKLAKASLVLSGGFLHRDSRGGGGNSNGFIFDALYNHSVRPGTDFRVGAHRRIGEALDVTETTPSGGRGVEEIVREGNPVLTTTELRIEAVHFLTPRLALHGVGRAILEEGTGNGGEDRFYLAGSGLAYYLRRNLTLNFVHVFTTRASNLPENEFSRHLFILGLSYNISSLVSIIDIQERRRGDIAHTL